MTDQIDRLSGLHPQPALVAIRCERLQFGNGIEQIDALRENGLSTGEIVDLIHGVAIFGWANRLMHTARPFRAGQTKEFRGSLIMTAISTGKAPAAIGPYSQARIAVGLLFVSGQLPIDPATGEFNSQDAF